MWRSSRFHRDRLGSIPHLQRDGRKVSEREIINDKEKLEDK